MRQAAQIATNVSPLCAPTEIIMNYKLDQVPQKQQELLIHHPRTTIAAHPASSCKNVLELDPTASSGYYYIGSENGNSNYVYCDMSRTCGGNKGWMQLMKWYDKSLTQLSTRLNRVAIPTAENMSVGMTQAVAAAPLWTSQHMEDYTVEFMEEWLPTSMHHQMDSTMVTLILICSCYIIIIIWMVWASLTAGIHANIIL